MTAPQLDRKLLAIMAADMVGYSKAMEADEAGTIARLRAIRAELTDTVIARHHGRIVKLMGDGALVVFRRLKAEPKPTWSTQPSGVPKLRTRKAARRKPQARPMVE